jgi:hypothetical protein
MNLNFGREMLAPIADEIVEAIARSGMDLQIDYYTALEAKGVLRVFTVRDRGNRLIGFVTLMVAMHTHYRTQPWGFIDLLWIAPDCAALAWEVSGAEVGLDACLLARAEASLFREGVYAIRGNANTDGAEAYLHLGYRAQEAIFEKACRPGSFDA